MISPVCEINKCGNELNEFGAILLSPPQGELVIKKHICVKCYNKYIVPLLSGNTELSITTFATNFIVPDEKNTTQDLFKTT